MPQVKRIVVALLVLGFSAGPWLCCCTLTAFGDAAVSMLLRHNTSRHTSSKHRHRCCGHQHGHMKTHVHETPAHRHESKEPCDPASPCPCEPEQHLKPVLTIALLAGPDELVRFMDNPCVSLGVFLSLSLHSVLSSLVQDSTASDDRFPPASCRDIQFSLQVLTC